MIRTCRIHRPLLPCYRIFLALAILSGAAPLLADKGNVPSLPGPWYVQSLSIRLKGESIEFPEGGEPRAGTRPYNVLFTEKTFVLRVGSEVVAEMSYALDRKHDPGAIDMKSPDGVMLGICAAKGNELQIGLNDRANGRPRDFNKRQVGMLLVLGRFLGQPLFVIDADGNHVRQLLAMPEFTYTGSPDWSPDGRRIAFDAWRAAMGETYTRAHIFVVNSDGSSPHDLGPGAMPSWSPDGKQLAYSQYSPHGVWIMNADGSGQKCIDAAGWGAEWSPKRNEIAYSVYQDGSANLAVRDLATNQRRLLLEKSYRQIWWGMSWSPDGAWICFKGRLPSGGEEIAAVSRDGEKKGFKIILPNSAVPESRTAQSTIAWGGTGSQILICMQKKSDFTQRLYLFDFSGDKPPQSFPPRRAGVQNSGMPWLPNGVAWSRDGKKVVFCARPHVKPDHR